MKKHILTLGLGLVCATVMVPEAEANHCGPNQIEGVTVYTRNVYKPFPGSCGGWKRTGTPTVLNGGLGVWQRACTYTCHGRVTTVRVCYGSRWDYLWARNGKRYKKSRVNLPLGDLIEKTQTKFCLTGTPPSDALPPQFTEIKVSSAAQVKLAQALASIVFPPYEPERPFGEVLQGAAAGFIEAADAMKALAIEASLPENNDANHSDPALALALLDISEGLAQIGYGLADWTFGQPETYRMIAENLRFIALHPVLMESELHSATSDGLLAAATVWDSIAESIVPAAAVFEIDPENPPQTIAGAVSELDVSVGSVRVLKLLHQAGEAGRQYGLRFSEVHEAVAVEVDEEACYEKPNPNHFEGKAK
ncbi:MAG: hypothetical protein AAF560_29960 [Acidobacteriota bacterium]